MGVAMPCGQNVRDKLNVKLHGWQSYVRAIAAQLAPDRSDALTPVHGSKRRLRDALERLERDAKESRTLAAAARANLCSASARLRGELGRLRPGRADSEHGQSRGIADAVQAIEAEMNAIALSQQNDDGCRLATSVERTVLAILRLEADMNAAEIELRGPPAADDAAASDRERELAERLRLLEAAIGRARRLSEAEARLVEEQIAFGVRRLRELVDGR
jgi:hypothetical protein